LKHHSSKLVLSSYDYKSMVMPPSMPRLPCLKSPSHLHLTQHQQGGLTYFDTGSKESRWK